MIDPKVLATQRAIATGAKRPEHRCPRCGRRTRNRQGVNCRFCHRESLMPDPRHLSDEMLLSHLHACVIEARRRAEAFGQAAELGETVMREAA